MIYWRTQAPNPENTLDFTAKRAKYLHALKVQGTEKVSAEQRSVCGNKSKFGWREDSFVQVKCPLCMKKVERS